MTTEHWPLSAVTFGLLALHAALSAPAALAAPPSFDAGALLEQLSRQAAPDPSRSSLPPQGTQPLETFGEFEFRELPAALVPAATEFLSRFRGRSVRVDALAMALYAFLQQRNPSDTYAFAVRQVGGRHVFVAQKVVFDGVTVSTNGSRSTDTFLAGVMGHGLVPGSPLDVARISRNAAVVNEIPGVASQFSMKPGELPGSSRVHLGVGRGADDAGSISADNSGTAELGSWTWRAEASAYNRLGRGDVWRVTGQLTRHSRSVGLDASGIAHPSGLRAGVSLATFRYAYDAQTEGLLAGNLQQTRSDYAGQSDSAGLVLSYPLHRTETARQDLGLVFNRNTTHSDVDIAQTTTIAGSAPPVVNDSAASYRLSDLLIEKATLTLAGARSLELAGTLQWQAALVAGRTTQRVAAAANQDGTTERTLGEFAKLTGQLQYSHSLRLLDQRQELLLTGEWQLSPRNLPGPEKAYLGGLYRMQAWKPQAMGGPQWVYARIQFTRPLQDIPGLSTGVFAELAGVQASRRAYLTSVGTQTLAVGTGWQALSDAGLVASWAAHPRISLTAALAWKLSGEPTVNGQRLQGDGRSRAWAGARLAF